MSKFTFGTDPEFFVKEGKKIRSAIEVIGRDKLNPYKKKGGYTFYYDNVLAECTIPPASSKEDAIDKIGTAVREFLKIVKPCEIDAIASCLMQPAELKHPEAMKVNCHPDICVYSLASMEIPEELMTTERLRSGGGHIHVGYNGQSEHFMPAIIQMMDLFLGVPSVFLDKDASSTRRRRLYGQAGRFRQTSYGVEYRSLSNFWLASPELVALMYELVEFAFQYVESGEYDKMWSIDIERLESDEAWNEEDFTPGSCFECTGYDVMRLREVIDTGNKRRGRSFMNLIQNEMPQELFARITEQADRRRVSLKKGWGLD